MSLIRAKFHQEDLFKTFDLTSADEDLQFPLSKRNQSNKPPEKTKFFHSKTIRPDLIQVSPLLKNLKKREVLVQCDNLQKARNLKSQMADPTQLQKEYNQIIQRYKNVKARYTMRPCKIPRSGIEIYVDHTKKRRYQVLITE